LDPQRPGLRAHEQAVRLDMPALVKGLRDLLGAKLVAYLGGVRETRAVRQWAEGSRAVQDKTDEYRLRLAYQVAALIAEKDSPAVVQADRGLTRHHPTQTERREFAGTGVGGPLGDAQERLCAGEGCGQREGED